MVTDGFILIHLLAYFEATFPNGIENGLTRFSSTFNAVRNIAGNKPVWITETGWPVSGPKSNLAVASVENARTYWVQVGCKLFGNVNTWWYTLQDTVPDTPSVSFGIIGSQLTTTPLYDLSCPQDSGLAPFSFFSLLFYF